MTLERLSSVLQLYSIAYLNFDATCNNAQRNLITDAYDDAMELARKAEKAAVNLNGNVSVFSDRKY
jgi:hypothetical protein